MPPCLLLIFISDEDISKVGVSRALFCFFQGCSFCLTDEGEVGSMSCKGALTEDNGGLDSGDPSVRGFNSTSQHCPYKSTTAYRCFGTL